MLLKLAFPLAVMLIFGQNGVQGAWYKNLPFYPSSEPEPVEVMADFDLNPRVNFLLKTRTTDESLTVDSAATLDPSMDTVFFVHGYMSGTGSALFDIPESLLEKKNVQTVYVDWSKDAFDHYPGAANQVPVTGATIAKFIMNQGLDNSKTHCVGHSLGAHTCGRAGKFIRGETGTPLARITGLDPANPLFSEGKPDERLTKYDAAFVDIIHSDYLYGETYPIGHMDFYPNGGRRQPGCGISAYKNMEVACNHERAILLYEATISSGKHFKALYCGANVAARSLEKCQKRGAELHFEDMGYNTKSVSKEGSYFLATGSEYPYAE